MSTITLLTYTMSSNNSQGSTTISSNTRARIIVHCQARPTGHRQVPLWLSCKKCNSYGGDCYVRRTLERPNGDTRTGCASCDDCSFVQINNAHAQAQLQDWLDDTKNNHDTSSPSLDTAISPNSGNASRAGKDLAPSTTPSSTKPQAPTMIKLKVPPPASTASSSSLSDVPSTVPMTPPHSGTSTLPSSRSTAEDGQGTQSKRSRKETDSTPDGAAPSIPPTKIARLDTTSGTDTPLPFDDFANQLQGKDPEFGRNILGLIVRHESVLKTQLTALAAVEDLRQDLARERKEKEVLRLQHSETKKDNAALVKERTAAALLAKDKAVEMTSVKKERDEAKASLVNVRSQLKEATKREASALEREKARERERMKEKEREKTILQEAVGAATKIQKQANDITIQKLEKRVLEEERQNNLAANNADASRRARNEAQSALAVVQADKDKVSRELETMTANYENLTIDLEDTRASLIRAQAEAAELVIVKAELVDARAEVQRLLSVNAQLTSSAEDIQDLKNKLESLGNVAKDRLDERNEMEVKRGEARAEAREWKQKAKEYKWNLHLAQDNLIKSNIRVKALERGHKDVKREIGGEGGPSNGKVEKEASLVIEISDDEEI